MGHGERQLAADSAQLADKKGGHGEAEKPRGKGREQKRVARHFFALAPLRSVPATGSPVWLRRH